MEYTNPSPKRVRERHWIAIKSAQTAKQYHILGSTTTDNLFLHNNENVILTSKDNVTTPSPIIYISFQ